MRSWAALSVLSFAPSIAFANGRFPAANQLVVDPGDAEHFLLRATYGLLSSHDAGGSFAWICEDLLGSIGDTDPAVAILRGGSLVLAAQDSLLVSDATSCGFANALAAGAMEFPVDVSVDPGDDSTGLAVSRSGDGSGDVHLFEIDGKSGLARALGASLGSDLFPLTLDAAPARPERIYVTALSTSPASVLVRSDDRGDSWKRLDIHPYEELQAYIAAVDPNDPDTLYVRVSDDPSDHLLVSVDAGDHFTEIMLPTSKLLGFALAPDGSAIALGGPGATLQIAQAGALDFQPIGPVFSYLSCLKWTPAGLYACADDQSDGFTLGLSVDQGATFTPLFHARDLAPIACDAETSVGSTCPRVWPSVKAVLGSGTMPADAGVARPASDMPGAPHAGGGCQVAVLGAPAAGWWLPWFGGLFVGWRRRVRKPVSKKARR
jgi:hypothetical protein